MTISCALLLVLAIVLELIKSIRIEFQQQNCSTNCRPSSSTIEQATDQGWTRKGRKHLADCALYGVQLTISYMLMLAVMTYNVWILISVVIGAVIGYFLFGENTYALDRTKDAHCN